MFWKYILDSKTPCSYECWHYGCFGGDEGCLSNEDLTGHPWPEQVKDGERCLYPHRKEIVQGFVVNTGNLADFLKLDIS